MKRSESDRVTPKTVREIYGLPPRPATSAAVKVLSNISQSNHLKNYISADDMARPKTSIRSIRSFDGSSLRNSLSTTNTFSTSLSSEYNNDSLLRIFSEREVQAESSAIAFAEKGDEKALTKLLSSKVIDVNRCIGLNGHTPLHHAASRGHGGIVALLRQAGANVNCVNSTGETPLHLAAYSGHLLVVEQLLDNDAEINLQNKDGETALFYAARRAMPAVVRLLIQRGADPAIRDELDDTAADQTTDPRTQAVFKSSLIIEVAGATGFLPFSCILKIFLCLEAKDVGSSACVSGKWHRVSESQEIWAKLGIRRWERSLQSSLGFSAAPASSFRPRIPSLGKGSRSSNRNNSSSGGVSWINRKPASR